MLKSHLKLLFSSLLILCLIHAGQALPIAEAQDGVDPRFGAVEAFWAADEATALGIGWERILFYWNQIQPFGPEDWNTLHVRDEWLAEAAAQGRTVVGLLKNTPVWATDGEAAAGVPRGLYLPIDDPGNLWANFARRVASFYAPRGVHHWIIWNEPDIAPEVYGHEFSGSVKDYYQLLKVAYQVIKQADPSATIHLGGLTHWHDPGYMRRFLQVVVADPEAAANNYFFDVVSLHIYFRPETVPVIVGGSYAVQQELGIQPLKPVWINETNARPSMDPEWPVQVQAFHIDLEQQAWYLVQAYALGFQAGAARIAVYKLVDIQMSPGDESWGLIRPHDFSRRPAYFAYQNIIKYLSGFTYPIQRERTADYYVISFPRPSGLTRVLWARNSSPVTISVPALAEGAMLVDPVTDERVPVAAVDGHYTLELTGARCHQECLIGGPPRFLVEEGVDPGLVPTAVPILPTVAPLPIPTISGTLTLTLTITATATPSPLPPTKTPIPTVTATSTLPATATATERATETMTVTPVPATPTTLPPQTSLSPTEIGAVVAESTIDLPANVDSPASSRPENVIETWQAYWGTVFGLGIVVGLLTLRWIRRRGDRG